MIGSHLPTADWPSYDAQLPRFDLHRDVLQGRLSRRLVPRRRDSLQLQRRRRRLGIRIALDAGRLVRHFLAQQELLDWINDSVSIFYNDTITNLWCILLEDIQKIITAS